MKGFSVSLLLLLLVAFVSGRGTYKRVCYYTNWSQYRDAPMTFTPEEVDAQKCDYGVYAFATMEGNQIKAFEWNDETIGTMKGMFERFNDLKLTNPTFKTLLAVGGWNFGTEKMTAMLATKENRAEFILSCADYVKKWNFDGLDLDFEYPGSRGSPAEDKGRFTELCQEMRVVFNKEGLMLTAAVGAGKTTIEAAYEIPEISKELDFLNLMTYDLNGAWNNYTSHNSPLYPRSDETDENRYLNVDWAANYWADMGAPKEKLMIGMPLYGRGFTLTDASQNGYNAPVSGASPNGEYTKEPGIYSYYEVCTMLDNGATRVWDDEAMVPYAYLNDVWVGYDDAESIKHKMNWLKSNNFGGVMVWSYDFDDFNNAKCGAGKYPLLTTIDSNL